LRVRIRWWRDSLRACRIAIPPLVAVLLLLGVVRFVGFMNAYGSDRSVLECVTLARGLGRLESLAAPFLIASVWVLVYPLVLGLRAISRRGERRRARRLTLPGEKRSPARSSANPSTEASGARRPKPAA
jgi:hypothetical protein